MKISRSFALASLMTLATSPVFAAGFSLNDVAGAVSGMQGGDKTAAAAPTPQAAGLLSALSSLNVTPEQAIGGTGAMLGLAKNQLGAADYSQLTNKVPGLDQLSGSNALGSLGGLSGLLSGSPGKSTGLDSALDNVKNTNDLNNAFTALGMDSGMIGQFAPILLQYLGQQGVGGSLLNSLGGIWGAGG
ncbi:hypothetical protein C1Y08_15075 [Pseudomonas sp. FW306-02-F02-AA]|uniref:DUF2780 domain-containing protein n=1 Tax=Pseudomonas fluorescens TaxID=294 RepID=A0A0N9W9Z7_PSEFL|nr:MULTISPECIES: DUF2780 domain-containing protein [Pseudomonas]ALI00922.1 hypothetical protein AO353_07615 [Pseudomonas fluorescens]PMZ02773.1 hypothetical protein C1Y07_18145 [Pseudomonas sp. FW306-02-F02-AB]PMZ09490.1 hypothetical protein C1Y06_13655 [Pseudomonas sp. FW306-02-H06C]PMZ15072.1 hypothetical protein C1Y08_15075 [Pseudomonas sp. FW306-02-F02-AA]PMZ23567.1 hypothetical protein C1Y09_01925 [Pseudomonas sp. FW306-02-F08-AA]